MSKSFSEKILGTRWQMTDIHYHLRLVYAFILENFNNASNVFLLIIILRNLSQFFLDFAFNLSEEYFFSSVVRFSP